MSEEYDPNILSLIRNLEETKIERDVVKSKFESRLNSRKECQYFKRIIGHYDTLNFYPIKPNSNELSLNDLNIPEEKKNYKEQINNIENHYIFNSINEIYNDSPNYNFLKYGLYLLYFKSNPADPSFINCSDIIKEGLLDVTLKIVEQSMIIQSENTHSCLKIIVKVLGNLSIHLNYEQKLLFLNKLYNPFVELCDKSTDKDLLCDMLIFLTNCSYDNNNKSNMIKLFTYFQENLISKISDIFDIYLEELYFDKCSQIIKVYCIFLNLYMSEDKLKITSDTIIEFNHKPYSLIFMTHYKSDCYESLYLISNLYHILYKRNKAEYVQCLFDGTFQKFFLNILANFNFRKYPQQIKVVCVFLKSLLLSFYIASQKQISEQTKFQCSFQTVIKCLVDNLSQIIMLKLDENIIVKILELFRVIINYGFFREQMINCLKNLIPFLNNYYHSTNDDLRKESKILIEDYNKLSNLK